MSRSHGISSSRGQRREVSITNIVFACSITLLPLFFSSASPLFPLLEFAPPQVIYSKDLVSLLLAPWTSPSSISRVFSRLLQSVLLFRLPKTSVIPCYAFWIAIALTRTLVGLLLSRSVGWAYPRLFNHWALYESSGGCGPSLLAYMVVSGVCPDLAVLLTSLRGRRWEVTESSALLAVCMLLSALDHAPWTYGIAIGIAILAIVHHSVFPTCYPPEATHVYPDPDSRHGFPSKRFPVDIQMALLLLAFISLPSIIMSLLIGPATLQIPSSPKDGVPFLEIVLLSYPRPNDTPSSPNQSILSQTISSYLPYVSSSTALSVFTHAAPSTHPSFSQAQLHFKDAPIIFFADNDKHPDMYQGQYLHLAEALRWISDKGTNGPEWVMLVEDDFPLCGEWGWQGVVRAMHALSRGHRIPTPETTKMWGGFVATGGSGLILHRTLLPILAQTLRVHALKISPFPAYIKRRPADIIVQDCLLGFDPLCPTAPSSKDTAGDIWFARRRPTMVITSRLIMDHIGGSSSTAKGRVYDPNKWRCGWRHPFHGRPEVAVVPV